MFQGAEEEVSLPLVFDLVMHLGCRGDSLVFPAVLATGLLKEVGLTELEPSSEAVQVGVSRIAELSFSPLARSLILRRPPGFPTAACHPSQRDFASAVLPGAGVP